MSYARWGADGSQVYVFAHAEGWIECHGCLLVRTPDDDPDFRAQSPWAMAVHLAEHRAAGHTVPDYAIERLREESTVRPLLSRLLAAGFDDVEIALRSTREVPAPTYRIIGYWEGEGIACAQIAGEDRDLERMEAGMLEKLEKLEERKAERGGKGTGSA
jgi:hypothetical protein